MQQRQVQPEDTFLPPPPEARSIGLGRPLFPPSECTGDSRPRAVAPARVPALLHRATGWAPIWCTGRQVGEHDSHPLTSQKTGAPEPITGETRKNPDLNGHGAAEGIVSAFFFQLFFKECAQSAR